MKNLFAIIAIMLLAGCTAPPPALYKAKTAFVAESAEAQARQMGAGMNIIGGYNPFWAGEPTTFRPEYFTTVKEAGFSTVRIPVFTFSHLMPDGRLDARWLERLDSVIRLAEENRLNVIIDEIDFRTGCTENTDACIAKLKLVWRDLAEHYRHAPASVLFELLNEPNGPVSPLWNQWLAELLAVVRESNPTRNVIIGPAQWNSIRYLSRLNLPEDDRHIILTFHYYKPFAFTHQGARWMGPYFASLRNVRWRGSKDQIAAINRDFDTVAQWAAAHHRPVFLGEYGVYNRYSRLADAAAWTQAVTHAADDRGFARAYWTFSGGFAAYDEPKDEWITPLLDAIRPRDSSR